MKKAIAILTVMIVLVGAVFATTNEQLIINATVCAVPPTFHIQGKLHSGSDWVDGATSGDSNVVDTGVNIAANNAVVDVRILQNNKSKYHSTATLTIKATELVNTTTGFTSYKTALPVASGLITEAATVASNISVAVPTTPATPSATSNVQYVLTYNGHNVNGSNTPVEVASFTFTWTAVEDLPLGDYQATITLEYTTP